MPKQKKRLLILIIFLLAILSLLGIPATINLLFKQTPHIPFFIAEWSAGEALNYYGAVLTFLGTSLLSIVALWQNHLIKISNEKHMEFLETLEKEKFIPKFMISNVCTLGMASNISFSLINISDNLAQNISVYDFSIVDENGVLSWRSNDEKRKIYMNSSTPEFKITIDNPPLKNPTEQFVFYLRYEDILSNPYTYVATGRLIEQQLCFDLQKYTH